MAGPDRDAPVRLTADEFTARFRAAARVLWTLAAGLLGDTTEAEDVCQEAFLAAYRKREQFDPHTDFQAWMGRFVRNVAANEVRKRGRRQTSSADPLELDGLERSRGGERPAGAPLDGHPLDRGAFDRDDFDGRLAAGLQALGELPRACLLLRTLRELSYAEIAELLAIPEGTAMSHVHRARTALRERLGEEAAPRTRVAGRDGARP